MKTKAVSSSEVLILTYQTIECHTSADNNLNLYCLKTSNFVQSFYYRSTMDIPVNQIFLVLLGTGGFIVMKKVQKKMRLPLHRPPVL